MRHILSKYLVTLSCLKHCFLFFYELHYQVILFVSLFSWHRNLNFLRQKLKTLLLEFSHQSIHRWMRKLSKVILEFILYIHTLYGFFFKLVMINNVIFVRNTSVSWCYTYRIHDMRKKKVKIKAQPKREEKKLTQVIG